MTSVPYQVEHAVEPTTRLLSVPATPQATPTELRVHGVSGSPATETLDRAIIGRVAGDDEAGFFRPRPEYGPAAVLGPGGARLEAYRWGNLTSGAAARAFWLLMLPFTLANVPIWMLPPMPRPVRRLGQTVCRVFALTISGTFVLAAIGVFLDLVAWQCASDSRCGDNQPLVRFFFAGFFAQTGRRLALASVGPVVVVTVLWLLAHRSWARYESYAKPARNPRGDGLATPTFWDGAQQVGRLRSLHTAAMFSVISAVLSYQLLAHDRGTDAYTGVDLAGVPVSTVVGAGAVVFLASVAVIAVVVLLLLLPVFVDRVSHSRTANAFSDVLMWLSMVLTAGALGYGLVPRAAWSVAGALPGYAKTVTYLFAGQTVLLALLMLIVLAFRHRAKGAMFGGFGAPMAASLGLGLGAAFSGAISYRVADLLDGSAALSPSLFAVRSLAGLGPPPSYQWAALGFVLMIVLAGFTMLWVYVVTRPVLRRRSRADTDEDFPNGRLEDRGRAKDIDHATANAQLTDLIALVATIAWFILAALGVGVTALALGDFGPVQLVSRTMPDNTALANTVSIVTNVGTYLISLTAVLLVFLGIQTYRNERVRRTVGIIWDVATFWPRAAHPLGPPCYAERAVPELVHRANWLATEQGGVILSGHSQGSVLCAATVLQLPPAARARTALLTYGSPLARLYERAFPAFFNDRVRAEIAGTLAGPDGRPRWINLWRRTDPIGGAVGVGDRRLPDPASFGPPPGDRLPPAPAGHSGYQLTPQFGKAVDELLRDLTGERDKIS